ncbi:MAG: redox-regulated ATPase YchF [Phycisphaerales bacterium]|nr:redox-regulated ATPase YchF [Phycisphaerales bacterium]
MEAGIVGLSNVGKTSLFNALTSAEAEVAEYPFTTTKPHVGEVIIPDPRLDRISEFITSEKTVHAHFKLVDLPALAEGGEGMGRSFLADVQMVDAIVCVARCFDDEAVMHPAGSINPVRDVETVQVELILTDMAVLEGVVDRATRAARAHDERAVFRLALCEKAQPILADEKPLRAGDWDERELAELIQLGMLSLKPMLIVANIAEDNMPNGGERTEELRAWAERAGGMSIVPLSIKVESELAQLEGEEHDELLEAMGLAEPATSVVAHAIFKLLGYQYFYTAGKKQNRAWPVRIGSTAPQAAGVIHTDFERGFIRVEVYNIADLFEFGSEKAIREARKMRVEGKHYVLQDGDLCHFLFNV